MDERTMDRVAKWFNKYMDIYDYEAVIIDGYIRILELDGLIIKPTFYHDDVAEIIADYYDLLFENIPVGGWRSLEDLEDNFMKLALDIANGEVKNGDDLILGICAGLTRIGELRTITEYKEYWE